MKVTFKSEKDANKIISKIKTAMGDRQLGQMVDFSCEGKQVVVTISKLGTSKLFFDHKVQGDDSQLTLTSEKIALTHKAFKDEVTEKILSVIKQAGGNITA